MPASASAATATPTRGLDVNIRSGPQMREYVAIADRIAAETRGPLLDWGCGWGQMAALLRDRGVAVEAYDYRPGEALHDVSLGRFAGFRVQVSGEPVALPYADDRFAAVLSCGVLEHVERPEDSLDELHRILAPRGRLYIYKLPNRSSYLEAIARRAGLYYHGMLEHDRLYDLPGTVEMLSAHGFRVDERRLSNMLPLTISHPLAARFARPIWRANLALSQVPVINRYATNVEAIATSV